MAIWRCCRRHPWLTPLAGAPRKSPNPSAKLRGREQQIRHSSRRERTQPEGCLERMGGDGQRWVGWDELGWMELLDPSRAGGLEGTSRTFGHSLAALGAVAVGHSPGQDREPWAGCGFGVGRGGRDTRALPSSTPSQVPLQVPIHLGKVGRGASAFGMCRSRYTDPWGLSPVLTLLGTPGSARLCPGQGCAGLQVRTCFVLNCSSPD